ncbi:hypothetical protein [Pseudochryseolinea flava]|uniref:Uncharacterized protein n=1 Tax=Pseudochryseolinea flava TaxID=2059302 RepID=A0A364Y7X8_9BACT|nr:hypothetical protein [Pseudochryseolinea flava]RAW02585.1 hypothetical protein DQQ10_00260 [Pseudochryseolinea flava]
MIVALTTACKDDDDDGNKLNNQAEFNGSKITLTGSLPMYDYFGRAVGETTVHDQDITSYGEGLQYDIETNPPTVSGAGDLITFKAVSNVATDAVEGEAAVFTFHDASVRIGVKPGTSDGTVYKITSGVLKSTVDNGASLDYSFEGTTEDGKSIKFSYTGYV